VSTSAVSGPSRPAALEQQLSGDVGVVAGPEPDRDIKMPRSTALVDQLTNTTSRPDRDKGRPTCVIP